MNKLLRLTRWVLALLVMLPTLASAHDFEAVNADGITIYYNITSSNEVAVTYRGSSYSQYNEYSGVVNIPSTVTYNGTNYSVTSISDRAFYCTGLTEVTIGNSVTSIGSYAFYSCNGLASVTIGNSVTSIGDRAFYDCSGLTEVTIGNSVTSIGSYAFYGCSGLTSVTIPNSVTEIGYSAFENCTGLTSVKVCNPIPENISIGGSIFLKVPVSTCTLYVPKGSKNLYASANQWKNFGTIEEFEEDNPNEPINPSTPNHLYGEDVSVYKNQKITVSVEMANEVEITAFQCDIIVPEGLSIAMDDDDEHDITLGSRAHRSHDLSTALTANGEVRLVCYSMKLSPFSGNDGELFAIHFNPAIAPGNYEVKITNIELTDTSENIYSPDDITINVEVKPYPNGDANGDGTVSISDVVAVANHILGNTPNGFIEDAADANGDGKITVADIVRIAIIILNQSASSAPTKAIAKTETYDSGEMNIRSFDIAAGVSEVAEVALDTPDYDVTALQFDITLPKGLTIKTDNSEYAFGLTGHATNDHLVQSDKLDDGSIRVICYSSNSINLSGREGAVITFPAIATNDFNGGDIEITGIEVVENDGTKHALAPVAVKVSETSGVELVGSDNAEAVYYSLQGVPVANPTKGIYVKVQNGKAERVLVK